MDKAFWTRRTWMRLAALSALISVAVGAFAAHGVHDAKAADWLRLGAQYQFMHAVAVVVCGVFMQLGARRARLPPGFFLAGSMFFSGSLYAMALGAPRWFGAITPIGGLLFLIGWGVLVWAAADIDRQA